MHPGHREREGYGRQASENVLNEGFAPDSVAGRCLVNTKEKLSGSDGCDCKLLVRRQRSLATFDVDQDRRVE